MKWRKALPALRGCDETLSHVLRTSGAAWDHVLHLPTRRAGAAGLGESGELLLPSRQQQWVPGIHRQELKSLGLIIAGKNSLFPPNIKVMLLISLLLWSHHWGPWALSTVNALSSSCRAPGAPRIRRVVDTECACWGLMKGTYNRSSLFLCHLYRWKCNLPPPEWNTGF